MNNRVVTQAAIYTMKFNPQGTAIASGSHDREICKFHIPFSWIQAFFWLRHIGFSNDVTAKILGMFDNNYSEVGLVLSCYICFLASVLWNVQGDCDNYMVLKGHRNAVLDLSWTADGQHIISASPDKTVRAWDAVTGKQVCSWLCPICISISEMHFSAAKSDNLVLSCQYVHSGLVCLLHMCLSGCCLLNVFGKVVFEFWFLTRST